MSRLLRLDPTSASASRRFVADVLPQWELDDLTESVALLVSELVTNAVLHTTGDVDFVVSQLSDRLRVEVCDKSERLPSRRFADDEDTGGQGLMILELLAQAWGIDPRGRGQGGVVRDGAGGPSGTGLTRSGPSRIPSARLHAGPAGQPRWRPTAVGDPRPAPGALRSRRRAGLT